VQTRFLEGTPQYAIKPTCAVAVLLNAHRRVVMEWSWMATIVFVAATGLAGLAATVPSKESYRSARRLLTVGVTVVLPSAVLAGLLFFS
jgi:hypothetical protein